MEKHHQEAIDVFLDRYTQDQSVLAVLLAGSLAHGFAKPDSDIDLSIITTTEEFRKRKAENKLAFSIWDICKYKGGYVDCKVSDLAMLELIAKKGSDPARYAFKDSWILFSRTDGLEELLSRIISYPVSRKESRRNRFASQMLAWKWYYGEGKKKENKYLQNLALHKQVLFSARLVLNENEMLYPYHKWLLKELEKAANKPDNMLKDIDGLLESPSVRRIEDYVKKVFDFIAYTEQTVDWPNYFLKDSEQNWISHEAPIDDL